MLKIRPFCSLNHFYEEKDKWRIIDTFIAPKRDKTLKKYLKSIIRRLIELMIGPIEYQLIEGIIDTIENADKYQLGRSFLGLIKQYDFENHFSDGRQLYYQAQLLILYRLIETVLFINEASFEKQNDYLLDLGDSNGFFINALKARKGLGSNIRLECCKMINQNGVLAISSDAQILPFRKKSFDYVLCFELFEHVPNPVLLLQEMRRVIKKGIFISIPYVKTSRVRSKGYTKGWSKSEHIFELSVIDFKNLLSQADLKVVREKYLCSRYPTKHLLKRWFRSNVPNWVLFEVTGR